MADSYLQFSEQISHITTAERAWWNERLDTFEEDTGYLGFEWEYTDKHDLWLYADSNGEIDHVATLVQEFIIEHRPSYVFTLQWAETCSKPMLGSFGGGAIIVTRHDVHWLGTHQWLEENIKKLPCPTEGCSNRGRYDSGYCGLCDIEFNDGQGEKREH